MSNITPYLANSRQFLIPVPGSRNLSSVVYGGLKAKLGKYFHHLTQMLNSYGIMGTPVFDINCVIRLLYTYLFSHHISSLAQIIDI